MSEGRNPSLARLREPDAPTQQGERRGYSVVKLVIRKDQSGNVLRENEREVNGFGTHIYLAELNGSDSVSVKIDVPGAGWITMEEGDIVSREFTRFWVRSNSRFGDPTNSFNTLGGPCEATFYVSVGPMILKAPKKYGFRSGFFTVGGTATANGINAWKNFRTQYTALFPKGLPAYLKYGGTLLIRNTDAVNKLYVFMGQVDANDQASPVFNATPGVYPTEITSIEIPPATTLPMLIENRLANLTHADGAGRVNTLICAASAGLTATFTVTASRMVFDFSDSESLIGGGVAGLDQ